MATRERRHGILRNVYVSFYVKFTLIFGNFSCIIQRFYLSLPTDKDNGQR